MKLSYRLLLIAVMQVIVTSVVTYYLVVNEYQKLSDQSLNAVEVFLLEQKQQELKNYTSLAVSAVDHLYGSATADSDVVKSLVANIFSNMLYGEDGYFFVYDGAGTNIMHPVEPFRIGQNYWDLENSKGEKMIQILIENAKNGGDYYRYPWLKPSLGELAEKMGYSVYLDKWDWMLGTGVYLDDVTSQLNQIHDKIVLHITNTKQIILLVALTSIFMIFLFGVAINISQKKKDDIKINELSQRVINIQEEQSRHISRELHDGIVQILVSIKYSLEATTKYLQKNKINRPEPLNHAESNLSTAIQEIRRISHHLHPRILDELGLSSAMETLAGEFSERTNIRVKIEKPRVRKLLPDNINTTLYRVVQEALTNIEKHANADNVLISLSITTNWLKLSISDDGSGIHNESEADRQNYGIGLRNLAERVSYHQGEFEVASTNKGTKVQARIPTSSFVNYFNRTNSEAV